MLLSMSVSYPLIHYARMKLEVCFLFSFSAESKCSELDISQAIKMPPMPGQSRSLLQFTPVKQEYGSPAAAPAAAPVKVEGAEEAAVKVEKEVAAVAAASSAAAHASGNPAEGFPPKVKREVMAGLGRNKASSPDHDYFGET